jgi:hypothetical protein
MKTIIYCCVEQTRGRTGNLSADGGDHSIQGLQGGHTPFVYLEHLVLNDGSD